MAAARPRTVHPYIVRRKNYCGGEPLIKGTKFPVRSVVTYVLRQGVTPEELITLFPHLTLAQVYDALSYYYDHKEEMDRILAENSEEYWPHSLQNRCPIASSG